MIFNVSYNDHKIKQQINDTVGKPFGLIDRWRMKGIGSGRLIIFECTEDLEMLIRKTNDTAYTNIEIRPKGIIVGIKSIRETYAWVIPYYKLSIFKTANYLAVYDGKNKLKARPTNKTDKLNVFLQKVMGLKDKNVTSIS